MNQTELVIFIVKGMNNILTNKRASLYIFIIFQVTMDCLEVAVPLYYFNLKEIEVAPLLGHALMRANAGKAFSAALHRSSVKSFFLLGGMSCF